MKTILSSAILQSKTRVGKDKFWQAHVATNDKKWYTLTSYWQVNKEGTKSQIQFSEPYEATPKNVGKANETTAEEQAVSEFQSMIDKQKDKGYIEAGKTSKIRPLPMLANKFSDRGSKVQWPACVQPKYNGQRMLFDGTTGWSRGGKEIIPDVIKHLQIDTKGHTLDGELILPGNVLLQETMKATKKFVDGVSDTLLYIVYDIVDPKLTFSERYKILSSIVNSKTSIILAPTHVVNNAAEVMKYHKEFTKAGFEGTMVRDDSEGYNIGHRSNQLLKYKDFVDAEFKIVDVKEGDGKFKGSAVFVCETTAGDDTFRCTPEGTMEYRRELFQNRKKYIGKWLTIRYQELSKDKVPLFPIGVDIRDKEDFDV